MKVYSLVVIACIVTALGGCDESQTESRYDREVAQELRILADGFYFPESTNDLAAALGPIEICVDKALDDDRLNTVDRLWLTLLSASVEKYWGNALMCLTLHDALSSPSDLPQEKGDCLGSMCRDTLELYKDILTTARRLES